MSLLHTLILPYNGSNLSLWLRKKIEQLPFRELLGIHLAGLAFFSVVIYPEVSDFASTIEVNLETQATVVESSVPMETSYQWPLTRFGLTTRFSLSHPGIDLTTSRGTAIYPIRRGWVAWIKELPWGYGKHLLVNHDQGFQSLYAHLDKISVVPGQEVSRTTQLGSIGNTGWSTGYHVHLEIYQNGVPVNPLDVLPQIPEKL